MSGYRYAVFGAGRQGTAAIHDLVTFCEAEAVIVVEPDAARRKAAGERLAKLLKRRASALTFAASADDQSLKRAHALLSCAPYSANVALTKRSLALDVPFLDLGGNPETVAEQEKLARKRSTPVVPDCGVSPGISNVLAVHCAREHGCDEVHVRCGGLPLELPDRAENPLTYKLVFSPWGLISEYSGAVPVIRRGKSSSVEALSVVERFADGLEASPTSNNSPQVVDYLRSLGVREYDYMTLRYDGHWGLVQGWKTLGFLRGDEARDRELATRLENDAVLHYDPKRDRDRLILSVRGSRAENGLRRTFDYHFDVAADTRTKFAAMELMTAWGITIAAHHIASGKGAPKGFATPERFVDTTWFLAEVEKRLAATQA